MEIWKYADMLFMWRRKARFHLVKMDTHFSEKRKWNWTKNTLMQGVNKLIVREAEHSRTGGKHPGRV